MLPASRPEPRLFHALLPQNHRHFVVNHLNRLRVRRAQYLLADTDRSIAEIGHEVGFCSQSYFGVVFRRVSGASPFAYRAQFRKSG
jgi:transcriptional regulator GlxA family with amidase domain